jgi:hypothetical protein
MKSFRLLILIVVASLLPLGASLAQAEDASVYVVHGIPGHDIGASADPALPVDVLVNNSVCLLKGLKFGEVAGPFTIPAGTYDFKISLANTLSPCSNSAVIDASGVSFVAGENASVVAYLTPASDPTAGKFDNDLSPTPAGQARVILHHTAAAGAVDIVLQRPRGPNPHTLKLSGVTNGAQAAAYVTTSGFGSLTSLLEPSLTVYPSGSRSAVFGPERLSLDAQSAYLLYAVGSPTTGTFTVIKKEIKSVGKQ